MDGFSQIDLHEQLLRRTFRNYKFNERNLVHYAVMARYFAETSKQIIRRIDNARQRELGSTAGGGRGARLPRHSLKPEDNRKPVGSKHAKVDAEREGV